MHTDHEPVAHIKIFVYFIVLCIFVDCYFAARLLPVRRGRIKMTRTQKGYAQLPSVLPSCSSRTT